MIKLFCDRCSKQITEDIYRVTFSSESSNKLTGSPRSTYDIFGEISNAIKTEIPTPRMYCKECSEDIEKYAHKAPFY